MIIGSCVSVYLLYVITEECLMVLLPVKEVICLSIIKSGVRHQRTGRVRGHPRLVRIEGVSGKSNLACESYCLWNTERLGLQ